HQADDQLREEVVWKEIVVRRLLRRLVRKLELGDAVQPNQQDVHHEQEYHRHRQNGRMNDVEAGQGVLVVDFARQEQVLANAADDRYLVGNIGPDGGAPVAELLVDEAVAGKAGSERAEQEQHADDPVQLARLAVGAGEVDA